MSVLLVFDRYGLDQAPALIATLDQLHSVRERIDRNLRNGEQDCLRVRLKPEYRPRFADFIGLRGVECLDIEPRAEFAKRFGFSAPLWAADSALAKLMARPPVNVSEGENEAARLLCLVSEDLVRPGSWPAFYDALSDPLLAELAWLDVEAVRQRLGETAGLFLPPDSASWLVERIAAFSTPAEALAHLARQRLYEHLRGFIQRHGLAFALPARVEPAEALDALPIWPVGLSVVGEKMASGWEAVLEKAVHKIECGDLKADVLAELAVVGWPSFMDALKNCLDEQRNLATVALADALEGLSGEAAARLACSIREQLTACEPLPENADIEASRLWLKRYLDYALRRYTAGQEPDEAVSMSFSHWVVRQQARIARSDLDWRRVAKLIIEHLKDRDARVIVCMVDALSALYNARLRDVLHESACDGDLVLEEDFLIAPYPSLTEIGKNAVLTGKPADQTSGTVENRLYHTYRQFLDSPQSIHVIKSWESRNDPIPEQTRLLVYLENRIDKRLHDCINYGKHHEDVEVIIKQLVKEIKRWTAQARKHGFEPVVLVTADHGVACIRTVEHAFHEETGICGERDIRFTRPPGRRDGFEIAEACGIHYLLPLRRVRLKGDTPLAHGGLTPEELLIPCLVMRRPVVTTPSPQPLTIRLVNNKAISISDGWQLRFLLVSADTAQGIRLEVKPPFRGKSGPYGPLQKGQDCEIGLNIQADFPQEGLVKLELEASFTREDSNTEKLFLGFDVYFPPKLLEVSHEMADFESMF